MGNANGKSSPASATDTQALRRPLMVLAAATLVAVGVLLLWFAGQILLLMFAGILVGILLSTASDWISRHTRLPYGGSLSLVLLAIVLLAAGTAFLIGRQLAEQVAEFVQELPETVRPIQEFLMDFAVGRWLLEQFAQPEQLLDEAGAFGQVTELLTTAGFGVVGVLIVLFMGIYTAAEPRTYVDGLLRLVPPHRRDRAREVLAATGYTLRWWLLGQLISMVAVGLLTGVGLMLLGMPFALTLGILAGILELIPTFGPLIAAVPALMIALAQGPMDLLWVALLYLGIQSFEGYVLVPLVYRQTVWLPPALTIPVVVLLGLLTGALGLFVAAPLTAAGMVLVKTIYVKNVLGDESIETPGEPDG